MHVAKMGYFQRCLRRAFAGSVVFTDKLSVVGGVLVPAILQTANKPVSDLIPAYISWAIIIAVGGGILLRFVSAPYFIWKEDQEEIARLKQQLGDPQSQARAAIAQRLTEARNFAIDFLAHHTVDMALRDGVSSIDDYSQMHAAMARIRLADPGIGPIADAFEGAHRMWLNHLRSSDGPVPMGIIDHYRDRGTALFRRLSLED